MSVDDAVARALSRLDAREDPAPAPELPPEPPEVLRVVNDLRLVVTEHSRGGVPQTISWDVLDGEGRKIDARVGVADLLVNSARLILSTKGWPAPLWKAARNVRSAVDELKRAARLLPEPR